MCYLHSPLSTGQMPGIQAETTDLYLILAEECRGPWSPEQLAEAVLVVLLEKAALEGPQPISIVHLKGEGLIMHDV